MNFSELKTRVLQISHRGDLAAQVVNFAADATERISRRFNVTLTPLVADADTNEVLTSFPLLYIYATLQALFEYTNNGDNAGYYSSAWETECDRQNVLHPGTCLDPYSATNPLVITQEP
jgi:hypothetical protein